MTITQETSDVIAFKDTNYFGTIAGIIMVLISIGLFTLALFGHTSNMLFVLGLALFFLVCGVVVVLNTAITNITFDKPSNKLTFIKKSLFGTKINDYPLSSIVRIDLREGYSLTNTSNNIGYGRMQSNLNYQLILILNNGSEVPLDQVQNAQTFGVNGIPITGGTGNERTMGHKLAAFLNIPFNDQGLPSIGQTVTDVISAVKNAAQQYSNKPNTPNSQA